MTMQNGRSSSRRRSGRGPRRNRDEGDRYDNSAPSTPQAPVKLSWWQKILAIFKPKSAPANGASKAPRTGERSQGRATVTSNYPKTGESRSGGESSYSPGGSSAAPSPRPVRKPEAVEVTSPKLYVGNLSFDATESDLTELFSGAGAVKVAEIVTNKQTEKSKGFAFVTMTSVDEAKRAVTELHDREFMGRKLVVSGAKTPIER
jgi:hypothetical protein